MCILDLGEIRIDLDADTVRKKGLRIAVIGESGSGKSWTVGALAEESLECGIQVVIFDLHGEHGGLAIVYDNVMVVGRSGDLPLSGRLAKLYREAYEKGFSIVFDLSEVFVDLNRYDDVVLPIVKELWLSHVEHRRSAIWIIEEAQLIAPQERTRDAMKRVNLMKSIAMGGRKFGVMLVLATQRPAELNKGVLSQCYIRLFGRLTETRDREAVKDYLKPIPPDELKRLPTGVFYVYGLRDEPFLARIKSVRRVKPGGYTPEVTATRPERSRKVLEELRERAVKILRAGGGGKEGTRDIREELARKDEEIRRLREALGRERRRVMELELQVEKLRMGEGNPVGLSPAVRGWIENFKYRVEAFVGRSKRRRRFLKAILLSDGRVSREWLAAEAGLSVSVAGKLASRLYKTFFVDVEGQRVHIIVRTHIRGNGTWIRNNLHEYSLAAAKLYGDVKLARIIETELRRIVERL